MQEIKQFREDVRAWLLGISGMTALVGQRVTHLFPLKKPTFPLVSFDLDYQPSTAYPIPAYQGTLSVSVSATDPDDIDAVIDLVAEAMSDGSVPATLSTAGKTQCLTIGGGRIGQATQAVHPWTGSYQYTTRPIDFDVALVALSEG